MTDHTLQRSILAEMRERWKTNKDEHDTFAPPAEPVKINQAKEESRTRGMSMLLAKIGNDKCMLTKNEVIATVCSVLHISPSAIRSRKRNQELVFSRNIVFYICRNYLDMTLKSCGEIFGMDHATVINNLKKFDILLQYNTHSFQQLVLVKMALGLS